MSAKSIKKWVFWTHLIAGLIAGIFVLCMSFTGVLLTYERQIVEFSERRYDVEPIHVNTNSAKQKNELASTEVSSGNSSGTSTGSSTRISTDDVVSILQTLKPDEPHIYVRLVNQEGAAIPAWAGRHSFLLHPYTGEVLREGEGSVGEFFHLVTDFHRYLSLAGDYRVIGKNITAYANLVFIFLIVSGLYLWLPKRFNLRAFKQQILLPKTYQNSHHRNRQWHFVFGIWCLIPLFVIALTATIFHFDWANKAIYGAFGESIPAREQHEEITSLAADIVPYETLFKAAQQHANANRYEDWYSMWMEIGEHKHEARFFIDKSIGHRQELAYSLFFDTQTGEVTQVLRKQDWSLGGQAWGTARFLHTGEYFGVVGQTVAGGVSLFACMLVYTGIVLAWRRLINEPRRRQRNAELQP